jgi:UPF0716 protein FxsA
MRRRFPWWLLVLAFIAVPVLEIYVIIQVGQVIGAWWTILLLIADGVIGSWLVKREGRRAWAALRTALQGGRMPATELADGMLILIGGTLMLSPGFVTDVVGVLLILPLTRPLGRRVLARTVTRRLAGRVGVMTGGMPTNSTRTTTRPGPTPPTEDVVRGEVVDEP